MRDEDINIALKLLNMGLIRHVVINPPKNKIDDIIKKNVDEFGHRVKQQLQGELC